MNRTTVSLDERMAILDLCAAYNWRTDTGDAEGVATLFTPDGAAPQRSGLCLPDGFRWVGPATW